MAERFEPLDEHVLENILQEDYSEFRKISIILGTTPELAPGMWAKARKGVKEMPLLTGVDEKSGDIVVYLSNGNIEPKAPYSEIRHPEHCGTKPVKYLHINYNSELKHYMGRYFKLKE